MVVTTFIETTIRDFLVSFTKVDLFIFVSQNGQFESYYLFFNISKEEGGVKEIIWNNFESE